MLGSLVALLGEDWSLLFNIYYKKKVLGILGDLAAILVED
jgi:hypothetical protein